jgi:hypothetical protein
LIIALIAVSKLCYKVMGLGMGRSGSCVENFVNSGQTALGLFGTKNDLVLRVFGKGNGEVPELGWKVGVQEKNTHGLPSMNRSPTQVPATAIHECDCT